MRASALTRALRHPILIICGVVMAAHAMILLNDGLYYDSWQYYLLQITGRTYLYIDQFIRVSVPQIAYFHLFFAALPNIVLGYRVAMFASLLLSAWLVYGIGREFARQTGWLSERESLWIALLSVTYPALQSLDDYSTYQYIIPLSPFLLALYLLLKPLNGAKFVVMRVAAALLFLLSFTAGSLLMFYAGAMLLLLLRDWRRNPVRGAALLPFLLNWGVRHLDLLLLPFVYWWGMKALFPSQSVTLPTYNEPRSEFFLSFSLWGRFIWNAILQIFAWSFGLIANGGVLVLLLVLHQLLIRWIGYDATPTHAPSRQATWGMLGVAVWLLFLGIFPYVAVGKVPNTHGIETRFSVLLGIPIAVGLVVLVRAMFTTPNGQLSTVGQLLHVVLLVSFIAAQTAQHIGWQAKWVKDRSVMVNLPRLPDANKVSVFKIEDRFFPAENDDIGWELRFYAPHEWSALLQLAMRNDKHPVVEEADVYLGPLFKNVTTTALRTEQQLYLMDRYDPAGCRAKVTIRPGERVMQKGATTYDPVELATRYWVFRYLQPSGLNEFLRGITRLDLTRVDSPSATNCGW